MRVVGVRALGIVLVLGLACFVAADGAGVHECVISGGGKASVTLKQFKAVNTTIGNLKTAMSGTYRAIKFAKYAHRYLAEFQYRFNRRFDLSIILKRLAWVAVRTKSTTRIAIRAAEGGCQSGTDMTCCGWCIRLST